MGVVFQMAALLGSLSVLENVGLPLIEVERAPKDEIRERVIEALGVGGPRYVNSPSIRAR